MFNTNHTTTALLEQFMYKVYAWMSVGLLTTAGSVFVIYQQPALLNWLFSSKLSFIAILFAQMGIITYVQARLVQISFGQATALLGLYSMLVGLTLCPLLMLYTAASIVYTFTVTAGMFGAMALYGYWTRSDLSRMGSILFMGLVGLIIAQCVNMFVASAQFDLFLCVIGVVLFTALTAYDVQKIKQMGLHIVEYNPHMAEKAALLGALRLYLDFINLFIRLLHLLDRRK